MGAQRLSTQVRNIEKKDILSIVERQKIHRKITGKDQNEDEDVKETHKEVTLILKEMVEMVASIVESDDEEEFEGFDRSTHMGRSESAEEMEIEDVIVEESAEESETIEISEEERALITRIREVMEECKGGSVQVPNIKEVNWRQTRKEIDLVNAATDKIETNSITELNYLLQAAGIVIAERLGKKRKTKKESN